MFRKNRARLAVWAFGEHSLYQLSTLDILGFTLLASIPLKPCSLERRALHGAVIESNSQRWSRTAHRA